MARTLILDIETAAFPFDSLDQERQTYLLKFAHSDAEIEEEKLKMNLWGLTAQTVAIGLWDLEREKGTVLYQHPDGKPWESDDGLIKYIPATEKEILERFWAGISYYQQYVTFNGRRFDYPFLLHRSAILGVETNRFFVQHYLKSRYSSRPHCDLLDQLSFYGSFQRKFSLDFYCKAFGIESPKSHGMNGLDVPPYFYEGRYQEIAQYCIQDVKATAQLYQRWYQTIDPFRMPDEEDIDL